MKNVCKEAEISHKCDDLYDLGLNDIRKVFCTRTTSEGEVLVLQSQRPIKYAFCLGNGEVCVGGGLSFA